MKRIARALLIGIAIAAQNPSTFRCDEHYQTFVKSGTITESGRCYDVYGHQSPPHRVKVPCR